MDKIAIISDIHGNLESLKEVLKDIRERGIEKIYCLGDIIAKGTHQQECVDLIRENCEIVIKGNCDEYFTSDLDISEKSEEEAKRIIWNKSKINEESAKYLRGLDFCYEFYMSGRLVRLVHAHPEGISKFVGNADTLERLYSLFLPSENTISGEKADVLIYGHIHTPFIQRIYNRCIINTGAVGNAIDVFRNEEKDGEIVKVKRFNIKPMSPEEAMLQMELIEHNFFVYRDADSNNVNVIYKRKDGNYGLLEPDYK